MAYRLKKETNFTENGLNKFRQNWLKYVFSKNCIYLYLLEVVDGWRTVSFEQSQFLVSLLNAPSDNGVWLFSHSRCTFREAAVARCRGGRCSILWHCWPVKWQRAERVGRQGSERVIDLRVCIRLSQVHGCVSLYWLAKVQPYTPTGCIAAALLHQNSDPKKYPHQTFVCEVII